MANEFKSGYALSIGIGAYKYLSSLTKSPTDAQDIADLLIQQCGYPAGQVAALIDARATKATISAKFEWLARRTTEQDTVVIFFSGHGAQRVGSFEPGEYLCPVETDVYNLRATAISSEEFSTALRAIPARKIVVFFDACHSGGVGEVKEAELQMKAGLSSQQYRRLAEGNGRVIIASCKPDEVSWEVKDMHNGLFTHYLLEGLRGEAAETNGEVSIFDLFQYTAKKVKVHGQQLGITQTPWFKAETEDFVVAMVQDLTKTTPAIDWEETMIGISSDLLYQLRNTLGRCQAFASNEALKSVFTDARLSLWAGSVPETNTSDERINQTITFLYKQENIHDENGLALLLRVLAESLSANDKLHRKLEALAGEISPQLHLTLEEQRKKRDPERKYAILLECMMELTEVEFVTLRNLMLRPRQRTRLTIPVTRSNFLADLETWGKLNDLEDVLKKDPDWSLRLSDLLEKLTQAG